jgi:hypothetical protein
MAGNITIVEARERYVKVPRDLTKGDISLAAVGLYAAILSFGKDWRLNIHGLSSVLGVSVGLVKKYMGELEKSGYVQRTRTKGDDGRFTGWDYTVGTERLKTPTSEETDGRKNRQSENPTVGKTDDRKIDAYNKDYNQQEELKVKEAYNKPNIDSAGFDFRRSLIDLGVPAALVDDWLKVRHAKRATNTQTAYEAIAREIKKSGRPAEVCIRFVVERSWAGFKAEWLNEEDSRTRRDTRPAAPKQESHMDYYARVMRELHPEEYGGIDNQ